MKNKEHGSFLCLQGGLEEMKPGRVMVSRDPEHGSDIWFYDGGFLKNKVGEEEGQGEERSRGEEEEEEEETRH